MRKLVRLLEHWHVTGLLGDNIMKICRHLPTGRILESRDDDAVAGTLIADSITGGFVESELEEQTISEEDFFAEIEIQNKSDFDAVATYDMKRLKEYPSVNELVVALWEGVVEERMAAVTKLEAERQAVKLKHPK